MFLAQNENFVFFQIRTKTEYLIFFRFSTMLQLTLLSRKENFSFVDLGRCCCPFLVWRKTKVSLFWLRTTLRVMLLAKNEILIFFDLKQSCPSRFWRKAKILFFRFGTMLPLTVLAKSWDIIFFDLWRCDTLRFRQTRDIPFLWI